MTVSWFHGGPPGLKPARVLLPQAETGAQTIQRAPGWTPLQVELGPKEGDRQNVYVTTNPWDAFHFAQARAGAVYEVEPRGRLVRDPTDPVACWLCRSARVTGTFLDIAAETREQIRALNRAVQVKILAGAHLGHPQPLRERAVALALLRQRPERFSAIPTGYLEATFMVHWRLGDRWASGLRPWPECRSGCRVRRRRDPRGDRRCVACGLRSGDPDRPGSVLDPWRRRLSPGAVREAQTARGTELAAFAERVEEGWASRHSAYSLNSIIHGPRHWRDVARLANEIRRETGRGAGGPLFLFACLHDSQRRSAGRDPGHGRRAAELLGRRDLPSLTSRQLSGLRDTLALHDAGQVAEQGRNRAIAWDADRLLLSRVGIDPVRERLSVPEVRRNLRRWIQVGWEIMLSFDQSWGEVADACL